jgi:hypothetical protein
VQGEVVEGSPNEIKVAIFVVAGVCTRGCPLAPTPLDLHPALPSFPAAAVTREYDPAQGALAWKTVELAMQGAQLYL